MTTDKLRVIDNSFPYPWSTLSVFYHVFIFCLFSRFIFTPLSCNEHSELYLECILLTEKKSYHDYCIYYYKNGFKLSIA